MEENSELIVAISIKQEVSLSQYVFFSSGHILRFPPQIQKSLKLEPSCTEDHRKALIDKIE